MAPRSRRGQAKNANKVAQVVTEAPALDHSPEVSEQPDCLLSPGKEESFTSTMPKLNLNFSNQMDNESVESSESEDTASPPKFPAAKYPLLSDHDGSDESEDLSDSAEEEENEDSESKEDREKEEKKIVKARSSQAKKAATAQAEKTKPKVQRKPKKEQIPLKDEEENLSRIPIKKRIANLVFEALELNDERKGVTVPTIKKHVIAKDMKGREWKKLMPMVRDAIENGIEEKLIIRPKASENMNGLHGRFKVNRTVLMKSKKEASTNAPKEKNKRRLDNTYLVASPMTKPKKEPKVKPTKKKSEEVPKKKSPKKTQTTQKVPKNPKTATSNPVEVKRGRRRSKSIDIPADQLKKLTKKSKAKASSNKRSQSADAPRGKVTKASKTKV